MTPTSVATVDIFVRKHPFFTTQWLAKFTTSKRREFERDVYDYARATALTKVQAKEEVLKARKLCGNGHDDSDISAWDGEVDNSGIILQELSQASARQSTSIGSEGTISGIKSSIEATDPNMPEQFSQQQILDTTPSSTPKHLGKSQENINSYTISQAFDNKIPTMAELSAHEDKSTDNVGRKRKRALSDLANDGHLGLSGKRAKLNWVGSPSNSAASDNNMIRKNRQERKKTRQTSERLNNIRDEPSDTQERNLIGAGEIDEPSPIHSQGVSAASHIAEPSPSFVKDQRSGAKDGAKAVTSSKQKKVKRRKRATGKLSASSTKLEEKAVVKPINDDQISLHYENSQGKTVDRPVSRETKQSGMVEIQNVEAKSKKSKKSKKPISKKKRALNEKVLNSPQSINANIPLEYDKENHNCRNIPENGLFPASLDFQSPMN